MKNTRKNDRGMALLMTLFALVVLSVIGLGMMSATNMETSINRNYREKQGVFYAVQSGLQEARDRINPATHNITAPTAMPSLSAARVIYIINPRSGETVAPWDIHNDYADTELCQEHVLGLTGTPGIPCTTLPTGSAWYSVVDDSQSSSAPWNTAAANVDFKWVRITLKGNNMTPIAVNGDSSDSRQVCWDGAHQVAIPAGYDTSCKPNGSLTSITVTNPGTGYATPPTVTISAPPTGGTQATATASTTLISSGQVASVTMTTGGYYTSTPSITFVGGGGTGAAATATWSAPGLPVSSVTFGSAGTQCYSVAPSVAITGGGGSGATATSTLSGTASCIANWNPSAHCGALKNTSVSNVALGGPGSSFTGTIAFDNGGHISSASIQTAGTGYTSVPTTASNATLTANSCTVTPNPTLGYLVSSVTLTNAGTGFTSTPTVTFATGAGTSGTTPSATAATGGSASNGSVTGVVITNPGTGYITAPTIIFGSGTGGAIATVNMGTTYNVNAVTINNPGAGYATAPTVTLSGGGGSGATATAVLGQGAAYGKVYLITALAQSRGGARAMAQMEVASAVTGFNAPGGLTLAGPSPTVGMPNSSSFLVSGHDANSCGGPALSDLTAVAGFDDPNANPATHSVTTIATAIPSGRTGNYTGAGGTPSVSNAYGALGDTMSTPTGMKALIDAVLAAPGANVYASDPGSIATGSASSPVVDYIAGDLTFGGSGYGVLAVTGTLTMNGNFSWHGLVLVIGDGVVNWGGGGNGNIVGSVLVAKIWDNFTNRNLLASLGSPSMDWSGGGGNGIQYDHCWAGNMMNMVPFLAPPSGQPLKNLVVRSLAY